MRNIYKAGVQKTDVEPTHILLKALSKAGIQQPKQIPDRVFLKQTNDAFEADAA